MRDLVLASASPRRRELLEQLGLVFTVDASDYPEDLDPKGDPHRLARRLAIAKAETIAARHPDAIIISADTFGVLDGRITGKPRNVEEACEMLKVLSGQAHRVITGLSVMDTQNGKSLTDSVETIVRIKSLTPEEIRSYVDSGEPMGKAGAYAIQGLGAALVERIEGDYFNVVGLPLFALARMLKEFDINILETTNRRNI